jgi:DNA-binding HxlR family transcriptional regulator
MAVGGNLVDMARGKSTTSPATSLGAPVEAFVRLIHGRYKSDILIRLGKKQRQRFTDLRRAIPGISERALARQLDDLERAGLVERTVYPEVPPRVEYCLTAFGSTLCPLLKEIWKWGVRHTSQSA